MRIIEGFGMKRFLLALAVLCGIASNASAQSVTVLGLQLGGSIEDPALCKKNAEIVEQLCWVDEVPPSWYRSGDVSFKSDTVPSWVLNGTAAIRISQKGLLDEVSIIFNSQTVSKKSADAVASISARFGKPTKTRYFNGKGVSVWNLKNIVIETGYDIYADWGYVEFKSPAWAKEERVMEAKIPKRPVTP